jgi:hypothetical protein
MQRNPSEAAVRFVSHDIISPPHDKGESSPPAAASRAPSRRPVVDDLPLDDPLVLEAALAFSASLLPLPLISLPLATLHLLSLALDIADPIAALAADLLGESHQLFDFVLRGVSLVQTLSKDWERNSHSEDTAGCNKRTRSPRNHTPAHRSPL